MMFSSLAEINRSDSKQKYKESGATTRHAYLQILRQSKNNSKESINKYLKTRSIDRDSSPNKFKSLDSSASSNETIRMGK